MGATAQTHGYFTLQLHRTLLSCVRLPSTLAAIMAPARMTCLHRSCSWHWWHVCMSHDPVVWVCAVLYRWCTDDLVEGRNLCTAQLLGCISSTTAPAVGIQ
jgi:hypothetical protein